MALLATENAHAALGMIGRELEAALRTWFLMGQLKAVPGAVILSAFVCLGRLGLKVSTTVLAFARKMWPLPCSATPTPFSSIDNPGSAIGACPVKTSVVVGFHAPQVYHIAMENS